MTKVIMKEKKKGTTFDCLNIGDCFFDVDNFFCIKVNSSTCLRLEKDLIDWDEYDDYNRYEEVFPVDAEIHIVS